MNASYVQIRGFHALSGLSRFPVSSLSTNSAILLPTANWGQNIYPVYPGLGRTNLSESLREVPGYSVRLILCAHGENTQTYGVSSCNRQILVGTPLSILYAALPAPLFQAPDVVNQRRGSIFDVLVQHHGG